MPNNVKLQRISWPGFKTWISNILGLDYNPDNPYSVCNLRPMFGLIFQDELEGYDLFGWCDIDVVWGDIRSIYTEEVLRANVVSSDSAITSGHFLLIKNEQWLRDAYLLLDDWQECLSKKGIVSWENSLDEARLSSIFSPDKWIRDQPGGADVPQRYWNNNHFVQQFCTPFVPQEWHDGSNEHPEIWFWDNGKVFNTRDEGRTFLYLHLMNFRAKRWVNEELYGKSRTWTDEGAPVCFSFVPQARRYRITRKGIWPEAGKDVGY